MSSKVKSEKTKVKFAQSNINHVYKGNTTETQHKPTIRPPGIQLLAKLQGTRRLPPPAWVPSLKAETGGLDSRVTLVPPGGSGWGAPSTTNSADTPATQTTEAINSTTTSTFSTVNGNSNRDSFAASLEPAYAKASYGIGQSTSIDAPKEKPFFTRTSANKEPTTTINGVDEVNAKSTSLTQGSTQGQDSSSSQRPHNDKSGLGGGLAANKPFFQRPAPVPAATSTASKNKSDTSTVVKAEGGAREVVGEPSGWAAVDQEEPDFEEQILFSDEDEATDDPKIITSSTVSNQAPETMGPTSVSSSFSSLIKTTVSNPTAPGKLFTPSVSDLSHHTAPFTSRPQSIYMDNSNLVASDTWSSSDLPFNCLAGQPLPRHPTPSLPYGIPSLGPQRVVGAENNRLLTDAQFLQHPVPTHSFTDSFLQAQLSQGRLVTPVSNSFVDSVRSTTDMDVELQQAQRHARLQEFESAIERAQQARVARQKLSENCSIETDNLLQKSMKLTSDNPDNRTISSMPTQISANAAHVAANLLLAPNNHPPASILNNISHQVLLSSAFHQSTNQGRSDLVAAVAAATAAAMAYPGGPASVSNKLGVEMSTNPPLNSSHSHTASAPVVTSNSVPASSWHGPFVSPSSTSSSMSGMLSQQPPIPQLLQNAFSLTAGGTHVPKPPYQQGVFVDPDFFVERFLEIFNQQQQQQSAFPSKTISSSDTAVQASSDLQSKYPTSGSANESVVNSGRNAAFGTENVSSVTSQDDKDSEIKTNSKSQRPAVSSHQSTSINPEPGSVESSSKPTRVPGLMDVKVTGATTHLAHLWDKDDYLCDTNFRSNRGRGKHSSFKNSRGSTRTRPTGRSQNMTRTTDMNDSRLVSSEYDSANRQHKGESNIRRAWSNSKSVALPHSTETAESQLISSHRKACSNEDLSGGEFSNKRSEDWGRSEIDNDGKAVMNSSGSETEGCGELSDVPEKSHLEWGDRHERDPNHETGNLDYKSVDKLRRGEQSAELQDGKETSNTYRGEYGGRRGRRGRPNSTSHFTSSSRKYNTDENITYGNRYPKESDVYSKHPYNNSTGYRGYRGATANSGTTQHKNRISDDSSYRPSERGSRNTYSRGFSGYFTGRNTQTQNYYDRENYSRDQNTQSFAENRFNTSDMRRPTRASKARSGTKGQFSSTNEYYNDYHYSDDEDVVSTRRRSQNRELAAAANRNRSHESSSRLHRGNYRKQSNPTSTYKSAEQSGDSTVQVFGHASDYTTKEKPPFETTKQMDDFDDSDIPTVRVPAADSMAYSRHQYSYSSTGRTGGIHRGSGATRRNNRSNQIHQQSKRSDDSNNQGSKRYRDQRDRYHDEKDGDGGAAAGGTGRSTTGGGSSSTNVRNDSSGTGGGSRASGNQCGGGGQSDSTTACNDSSNDQVPQSSFEANDVSDSTSAVVDATNVKQTGSNVNNTSSTQSSSGFGRHRSTCTAPGNISDANDADEWETASEGSPGARSVSSPSPHASLESKSCTSPHDRVNQSETLTSLVIAPSDQAQATNSIFVATSMCTNDALSLADLSKTTHPKRMSLGADDAVVDVPKTVPQDLNRSREMNTGCHVAAQIESPHYRRDNDDGSGGTSGGRSGTTGGSEVPSFTSNLAPSVNSSTRKEKSNASNTGGRLNSNQEFHRKVYGTTRSYYATQTRRNHSNIPPLMSIKPQGPFAEKQYVFDSMNWDCCSEKDRTGATIASDNDQKDSQPSSASSEANKNVTTDVVDNSNDTDAVHADGFTKVVSKASKNLARRRMQQELSNGNKMVSRKSDDQKAVGNTIRLNDDDQSHLDRVSTAKLNHTSKVNSSNKTTPKKIKPMTHKLTFLGPPLCLPSTTSTSLSSSQKSEHFTSSANSASATRHVSVSATRTWSKVVGTKYTSTPSAPTNVTISSSSPCATSPINPNPVWQVDSVKQPTVTTAAIASKQSDMSNGKCEEAFAPLNSCNEPKKLVAVSDTVSCTYTSMQSFWSTGDSVCKAEPQSPRLLLPPSVPTATVPTALGTTSPSSSSVTQASNNICKVKPQQQQQSFQTNTTSSSILTPSGTLQLTTPLSPIINAGDAVGCTHACAADLSPERDRQDYECNSDIDRPGPVMRQLSTEVPSSSFAGRLAPSWNSSGALYSPFSGHQMSNIHVQSQDNALSTSTWPIIEQSLDAGVTCVPGTYNANSNTSHYPHPLSSNVLSNLFASNSAVQSMDNLNKPSHATAPNPRPPPQPMQPYQHSILPSSDQMGLYSNGPYGNSAVDMGKLSSSNLGVAAQQVTFASAAASLYMHPQQPANNQTQHNRSYPPSIALQPSQIHQSQKVRQRLTQQVDPTQYATLPAFPTDLQNEYTFLPSANGCVQPPTGGLYSSMHGQSQHTYAQNPGRQGMGPPTANPWSLLGNPTASNPQGNGQGYVPTLAHTAGAGGGLLPHPLPQGGYGNPQCHFPNSVSNPGSNFANPPNYVGVIGGGRPHTDQSNNSSRQRSIQHHNLYQHPNLRQSPTAQGQQTFQLHSAFYPSLSPSHQRIPLQQFGDSQGRGTVPGHLNPQSGLYAAAFGAHAHHNNQSTPPPIGHQVNPINFFNAPFQFPTRPDGLH